MISFQFRLEGISALFFRPFFKNMLIFRRVVSSRGIESLLESQYLREIFRVSDSEQLSSLPFVQRIIKTYQGNYVQSKETNLVRNLAEIPYEFNFSSICSNIYQLLGEFSEKLSSFIASFPQDNNQMSQLAFHSIESFILDEIADSLVTLSLDKKADIEFQKIILHTIDALAGPVREEISDYFALGQSPLSTRQFLHSQSTKVQQAILKKLQDSILELLPLEAGPNKDFFIYLKSLYQIKLSELGLEVKNLLFWNVLNFANGKITDSFYQDTNKGTIEGPEAAVIQHYKGILQQMHAYFEESFPDSPDQYEILFSPLRQPIECIESCSFYDLTTVSGRSEKYGLINVRRFIQTLDALRSSTWAAKTPYSGNPKVTMKSVIEDVIKKVKTEMRF